MKKIIAVILMLMITFMPVSAEDFPKIVATMNSEFRIAKKTENIEFTLNEDLYIDENTTIPKYSKVNAEIYKSQVEKRLHKSGYFICILKNYITEDSQYNDISKKGIYLIGRKHEPLDPVDIATTGAEFTTMTLVGILIPGSDIAYYFVRGAVQRNKHHNWFKSGVSNAYDNSVFWLFEKGKPINLKSEDEISIMQITKEDAEEIKNEMEKNDKNLKNNAL